MPAHWVLNQLCVQVLEAHGCRSLCFQVFWAPGAATQWFVFALSMLRWQSADGVVRRKTTLLSHVLANQQGLRVRRGRKLSSPSLAEVWTKPGAQPPAADARGRVGARWRCW